MKSVGTAAGLLLVLAVAALMVADLAAAQGTPACDEMNKMVATCVKYLTGEEDRPSAECCQGARLLQASTSTTEARRSACDCLKEAATKGKDIKDERVGSIPGECSVSPSASARGPTAEQFPRSRRWMS